MESRSALGCLPEMAETFIAESQSCSDVRGNLPLPTSCVHHEWIATACSNHPQRPRVTAFFGQFFRYLPGFNKNEFNFDVTGVKRCGITNLEGIFSIYYNDKN